MPFVKIKYFWLFYLNCIFLSGWNFYFLQSMVWLLQNGSSEKIWRNCQKSLLQHILVPITSFNNYQFWWGIKTRALMNIFLFPGWVLGTRPEWFMRNPFRVCNTRFISYITCDLNVALQKCNIRFISLDTLRQGCRVTFLPSVITLG